MRPHRALANCLLAALLTACASTPQLQTAEERSGPLTFAKPFESGTVSAGVYTPSDAEKALDCKRLRGSMTIIIARLKDASNRPRASATTAAVQSGVASIKGRPNVMDLDAELQRERTRLTAYNGLLVEKKCSPMDLAKELNAL